MLLLKCWLCVHSQRWVVQSHEMDSLLKQLALLWIVRP